MSAAWQFHPILSSFPSVGFVTAALLEIGRMIVPRRINSSMVGVGLVVAVIGTVAAYFSGTVAATTASHTFSVPDEVIALHYTWGRMLLFAALPTLGLFWIAERAQFYREAFKWAYRVMLLGCLGVCVVAAHLGGELVFEHGAGVAVESK